MHSHSSCKDFDPNRRVAAVERGHEERTCRPKLCLFVYVFPRTPNIGEIGKYFYLHLVLFHCTEIFLIPWKSDFRAYTWYAC